MSPIAKLGRQECCDARRARWPQIFIQPVDNEQQVPILGTRLLADVLLSCSELMQSNCCLIGINKLGQLRNDSREEVAAIGISFPTGQEVSHHIYR